MLIGDKMIDNFNDAMFLSKVDNVFVKIFTAVMLDELDDVKHFMSDKIYLDLKNNNINLNNLGRRQMYDEINVKSSRIDSINKDGDSYIIEVSLDARYMDYIIDLNSGEKVFGDDTRRVEVPYKLIFKKDINSSNQGMVRRCPGCGHPMDINDSGKCDYCGTIYNLEEYDFILDSIEKRLV